MTTITEILTEIEPILAEDDVFAVGSAVGTDNTFVYFSPDEETRIGLAFWEEEGDIFAAEQRRILTTKGNWWVDEEAEPVEISIDGIVNFIRTGYLY